ncbi:protein split ends [Trichonephila clavipes]|nr:protein split ends [Trichonephila clavipes]
MMYSESREEVENNSLVPPTSAIGPHNSRQPQHAHYASRIFQFSTHIPSPHDRTTDSPVPANLCNAQGRISQISLAGQVDDHSLGVHSSHLYKNDVVGRSSNPAHSPNSHSYKKDTGHSQQIASLHNPASDKIVSSDHSTKAYNARTLGIPVGASISPGPWSSGIQSPRPHIILNEQSAHVLPFTHTMSQSANIAISHQAGVPAYPIQHGDQLLIQPYPVAWQGILALKSVQTAVQMHYVSGNPGIASSSLPPYDVNSSPLRIARRMRLEPLQLEGVKKKIQLADEHCVLMALPCGKDHMDVLHQSSNLRSGFISYLERKTAAGMVNVAHPGSNHPAYVIHIFPSCDFTNSQLTKIPQDLLKVIREIAHLVIVIAIV